MEAGDMSGLFGALAPVGTVQAVRQTYQVFRTAEGLFVVFSPSNRGTMSYHMSLVPAGKVEALGEAVTKEGVTSGSLMKDDKVAEVLGEGDKAGTRYDVLMALYVLTAQGTVEMSKAGRNLVFKKVGKK
jgi:hypothetical protein